MRPLVKKLLFATALCLGLYPTIVSTQMWQPRTVGTKSGNLTLTETTSPSAPTIVSSVALGTIVSQFTNTWSNSEAFVGANIFAAPNWDADTYTINGDYLIVAPLGPGVGGAGGTTQHVTAVAVQMNMSVDGTISNAPAGGVLANKWGLWNWGPVVNGRQMNGWGYQTGDYVVYLNGSEVGTGTILEVAHSSVLYLFSAYFNTWYTWDGTQFVGSAPP